MIQSPPCKRSKLDVLTSARLVERDFYPRHYNRSRRRARSAPAVGRQPVGNDGDAPSTEDAGLSEDGLAGFQDDHADDHVEIERNIHLPDFPQQQSHRSETAQQNANAWDTVRHHILDSYVRNLVLNGQLVLNRKLNLQSSVQRAVESAGGICPSCIPLHQNIDLVKGVEVLWAGCFPSTPVQAWDVSKAKQGERPVWFDLSLLQEVDLQLFVIKRLSIDRLSAAIMRVHEEHGCQDELSWDTFRKRLGQAVMQLGYILQRCSNMRELGAQDYPSGLLSECGGCWTAGQPHEERDQSALRLHSAYIDWCFKLPHLRTADKSSAVADTGTSAPPNAHFFVPDIEVLEHLDLRDSKAPLPDEDKLCSDFKADEALGRMSDGKYDITSLGVCLCRHGFVMYLMNSFSGERHAYATLFLKKLLEQGIAPQFIWYDINCRWSISFKRWLLSQPEEMCRIAEGIQYPLPPFHLFAHSAECQRISSSVRMPGAGRGNGEPHENFNADFGPLGRTTQYMTRMNREGRIERGAHLSAVDKSLRLPAILCRMEVRAASGKQMAEDNFKQVMEQVSALGLTNAEVTAKMLEQANLDPASSALDMPWEARLAEALLILHKADQAEGDICTPGLALLFEDRAFAKLSATSARVKSAAAAAKRLQREHAAELAGQDVNVGSEDFEALLARLVEHNILRLQLDIERLVRVRMDVDALMPTLAERPKDQARLKKTLVNSASTIDSRAARLKEWVSGSFVPEALLAGEVKALRESVPEWDFDGIRRGVFPWHPDAEGGRDLSESQLISRLVLFNREKRRCVEELDLLALEKQSALQLYERQASALRSGLDQIEQEVQQSEHAHEGADAGQHAEGGSHAVWANALLKGRRYLLEKQLQQVQRINNAARAAFGISSAVHALAQAEECAPDFVHEEGLGVVADVEDGEPLCTSDNED